MANLIGRSFFAGEINIPNRDRPEVSSDLDWFITKYEPIFLNYALGQSFATAFLAGVVLPSPEQRWLDLKSGVSYVDSSSRPFSWKGLVDQDSPIAKFIYYWWARNMVTHTGGTGEQNPEVENANRASNAWRQSQAWNACAIRVHNLQHYLNSSAAIYPEWSNQNITIARKYFKQVNEMNI